jgi:hypothetical protein
MADVYQYPGVTPFVEAAARDAGAAHPDATARGARLQPALGAVDRVAAVLAERVRDGGQARIDSPEGFRRATADLLSHAHAARTELAVALAAADLILAELTERLGLDEPTEPTEPETPPPSPVPPAPTDPAPTDPAPTDPAPTELMAPEVDAEPTEATPFGPWTGEAEADPGDGTDPGPTGRRHRRRKGEG